MKISTANVLHIRCACGSSLSALLHAARVGALDVEAIQFSSGGDSVRHRLLGLDLQQVIMEPGRPAAEQARQLVAGYQPQTPSSVT